MAINGQSLAIKTGDAAEKLPAIKNVTSLTQV
jgi:hypothetical protein